MLCGGWSQMGFCEIKNRFYTPEHLMHTNNCGFFVYNPIDALRHNPKGHVPKRPSVADARDRNQTTIYDFLGGQEC
jgi:hypothetical protein